ncbi:MAG: ribonuclease HI family protein [Candidatus Omnitrophica bacterium]|nr:ribonuclease HI family protein [Candidatus Omnitrophota bacterium]MCM8806563.1 ribonuclease HI family protein [Candidatus Omnitrophota bacterium]
MDKIEVYIDGSSKGNPGKSAYGIVIFKNGKIYKKLGNYIGITTNNVAEYLSLIFALIECLEFANEEIEIKSDSQLLVKQINKEYKIADPQLKILKFIADGLISRYNKIAIKYIPREENKIADKVANTFIEKELLF